MKELIESIMASGLIYVNSHAVDFQSPELRPYPTPTSAAPTAATRWRASS